MSLPGWLAGRTRVLPLSLCVCAYVRLCHAACHALRPTSFRPVTRKLWAPSCLHAIAEAAKSQASALRRRVDLVVPIGSDPLQGEESAQAAVEEEVLGDEATDVEVVEIRPEDVAYAVAVEELPATPEEVQAAAEEAAAYEAASL